MSRERFVLGVDAELERVLLVVQRLVCRPFGDLVDRQHVSRPAGGQLSGVVQRLVVVDTVRHEASEPEVEDRSLVRPGDELVADGQRLSVVGVDGERVDDVGHTVVVVVVVVEVRELVTIRVRRDGCGRTGVRAVIDFVGVGEPVTVLVEVWHVRPDTPDVLVGWLEDGDVVAPVGGRPHGPAVEVVVSLRGDVERRAAEVGEQRRLRDDIVSRRVQLDTPNVAAETRGQQVTLQRVVEVAGGVLVETVRRGTELDECVRVVRGVLVVTLDRVGRRNGTRVAAAVRIPPNGCRVATVVSLSGDVVESVLVGAAVVLVRFVRTDPFGTLVRRRTAPPAVGAVVNRVQLTVLGQHEVVRVAVPW